MQREKPNATLDTMRSMNGALVIGTMIENFREGWAKDVFRGRKVHYWKREGFDTADSRCSLTAKVRWLYGEGNFPRCKRCMRSVTT